MPAPRDESSESLSLLQKQLILSQVRILEFEDLRDELLASLAAKTKILTELQTLADQAFAEIDSARRAKTDAEGALRLAEDELRDRQRQANALEAEILAATQRSAELAAALSAARAGEAAHMERAESLEKSLRDIRASRSWRWTAPLRSVARLFS